MKRYGLFGGSFDPVHRGHLLVAQTALEALALDRLFFVPAAQSPFKPEHQLAPAPLRLRMLRQALAGHPAYEIDVQEVQRGGVSYTIDTVRDYEARIPGAEAFYLIGGDHVSQLPRWREAESLAARVQFVVIPRPGETVAPLPAPYRLHVLSGFPMAVSSTEIRARVRQSLPIDTLTPRAVAETIRNNQLYL